MRRSHGRAPDLRGFVHDLEEWLIRTLAVFGRDGRATRRPHRHLGRARRPFGGSGREDKIAALGIRIRGWVTFHGVSLNVDPDLGHFSGIVPCGVRDHGVTSLAHLGIAASMAKVDTALRESFAAVFADLFGLVERRDLRRAQGQVPPRATATRAGRGPVALAIGATTPGRSRSQAIATSAIDTPRPWRNLFQPRRAAPRFSGVM